MSKSAVIVAQPRSTSGTQAARRLRAEGNVPAILYGHKQVPALLSVVEIDLRALLRHGAHGLLDVEFDGRTESAVIKELQWDNLGREILHVDFARVARGEKVTVDVEIVLKGAAPGVADGGVVNFQLHSVQVECSAEKIIEQLVVNIGSLMIGQSILVKDLHVEEGSVVKNDPDQIVVQVNSPVAEPEPEIGAVAVEPELIRREVKEDAEKE